MRCPDFFVSTLVMLAAAGGGAVAQSQPPAPTVHCDQPAVSPDGTLVAFVSERSGVARVYVIGADGAREHALGGPDGAQQAPAWTPDGRVTFASFANDITQISSAKPDGSDLRVVAHVPGRMVSISPDGRRVAYMTGGYTTSRLMVQSLAGGDPVAFTDGKSPAWNYRWSPDGKKIAFTGKSAAGPLAVFVINADGTGLTQLTHLTESDGAAQVPDWSPSGRQLLFQATRKGSAELWVMDADGTRARKMLPHAEPFHDEYPRWFPDGTRLAFQSDRTGQIEIWIVNVDGSGLTQLTR